jgi:gliding motility-associated-like protein
VNFSVEKSSAEGCTAEADIDVTINERPETGDITGAAEVCENDTNVSFSVSSNPGSTYAWSVPSGATISSIPADSNAITVDFGSTGGTVTVTETNSLGCEDNTGAASFTVNVNSLPTNTSIAGKFDVCAGEEGVTYTVAGDANSTFTWLGIPSEADSSVSGNTITLDFGTTARTDALVVLEETDTGCTGQVETELITIHGSPGLQPIQGEDNGCEDAIFMYSVTDNPDSDYEWSITPSTDGQIVSGQGSSSVEVRFTDVDITLTVRETSEFGCSREDTASNKFISIINLVENLSFDTTPSGQICDFKSQLNYTFTASADNATQYNWWATPTDSALVSSTSPTIDSFIVVFDTLTSEVTVHVSAENACNTTDTISYTLEVEESITQQVTLSAPPACEGLGNAFYVSTSVPDTMASYLWMRNGNPVLDSTSSSIFFSDIDDQDEIVVVMNSSMCIDEANSDLDDTTLADVRVSPEAVAMADMELEELMIPDVQQIELNGTNSRGDITTYSWSYYMDEAARDTLINANITGASEEIAKATPDRKITTYYLVVSNGVCTDMDSVKVLIDFELFIPSGFSPNGDGHYDTWIIKNIHEFPEAHIIVRNRWGDVVYDPGQGVLTPWDGTRNGNLLPMGTYFYVVDLGNNSNPLVGPVTILK